MLNSMPAPRVISTDCQISTVMSSLQTNTTIKIMLENRTGILLDEAQYDGLIETLKILQENPTIVHSLAEREQDERISEEEFLNYV